MWFVHTPDEWEVTLVSGQVVRLWAENVGGIEPQTPDEPFRFSALMDIGESDQQWFEIEGRTAGNPERVVVVLAEFPRAAVAKINEMYPLVDD